MKLNFNKNNDGLLPAIIQDANSNEVLMLGYMNEQAYKKTFEDKLVTFYSRSKQRLWTKGESSGNYLAVKSIKPDCDGDTLLITVIPNGPACHTGSNSCFGNIPEENNFFEVLQETIRQRKINPADNSYTSGLFLSGINKIAQKVGEEAVELIIESKDNDQDKFLNEAADLLFHFMILLQAKNCTWKDVEKVLESRNKKTAFKQEY